MPTRDGGCSFDDPAVRVLSDCCSTKGGVWHLRCQATCSAHTRHGMQLDGCASSNEGTTLQVDFETELDLAPFMSNRRGPPQPYSLYGVLVHSGHSVHSGHYFAFVKAPNGLWHQLDDNHVSQVGQHVPLSLLTSLLLSLYHLALWRTLCQVESQSIGQMQNEPEEAVHSNHVISAC